MFKALWNIGIKYSQLLVNSKGENTKGRRYRDRELFMIKSREKRLIFAIRYIINYMEREIEFSIS